MIDISRHQAIVRDANHHEAHQCCNQCQAADANFSCEYETLIAGKNVLAFAAVGEIATGVGLLIAPSLVGQWLFEVELVGIAVTLARLAGIALVGLGVACWPGTPRLGMVVYSVAAALYLAYIGYSGGPIGVLLWPAVVLHVVLAALLSRGLSSVDATRI
jgi:hypothetical protein